MPISLRSEQQFRIAAAYLRGKQVQPAIALFNQALASLGSVPRPSSGQNFGQNPDQDLDAIATQGIIQFAQAGGVTTATRAAQQQSKAPALMRAQMWLAIAGEARQQKRSKEAAPALTQLIAAGRQGQEQNFNTPYGFNGLGNRQWGNSLHKLSQLEGYQGEFIQFIQQLKIEAEAAEFLIVMAVQAKQFDQAQRLIPSPLIFKNEAGHLTYRSLGDCGLPSPLLRQETATAHCPG
ncbi:MAG: hypothetical protein HC824_13235 [Synechococcales cyanobacterium RM1_1_8]|nr:hypothetical protein [Synechococcales cyanobacterium RM1_1_8]